MLQNLHTHTTYCDGKDSPLHMLNTAISKGFVSLGFSSHAQTSIKDTCEMQRIDSYVKEIRALQKKFSKETKVFLEIELDLYSHGLIDPKLFDYSICSVHYSILPSGKIISYDYSSEITEKYIKEDFSGDGLSYARSYYENVAKLTPLTDRCFVGHFDLVSRKRIERIRL